MTKINLGKKEVVHFIGLGGIGMSGLAQIMKNMGFKVQGSDLNINKNTDNCRRAGIKFFQGHSKKNISNATIIVRSSAIKKNNVELLEASIKGIPSFDRIDMLSNIVALKKNIIITGSHGKTTTTSLVAKILSTAKLDPTIINGGVINSIKNNAKLGKGEWAVIEADESDGSFLKVPISYSIVTNVDKEHLDYYKNYENLKIAFSKFINKTPPIGKAILCLDNLNLRKLINKTKIKNYLTYGFCKNSNYQILNPRYGIDYSKFDLKVQNLGLRTIYIRNIFLKLMGNYNILNATAAIGVCLNLGINILTIKKALKNFSGVQRRLTKVFKKNKIEFYDDYAHHPTEIESVLEGVKKISKERKILVVFQPHRYSRVTTLKKEFAKSFRKANQVILCPVYAAGEKKNKLYNQNKFADLIKKFSKVQVVNIHSEIDLIKYFRKNLLNDEIVIGMGAGSISKWIYNLKEML